MKLTTLVVRSVRPTRVCGGEYVVFIMIIIMTINLINNIGLSVGEI